MTVIKTEPMTYHKIQSVFKRDPDNNYKTFLYDQYTLPAFDYLSNALWKGTEKVDGMNMRISTTYIGGRTNNAQIPGDLYAACQGIQERMRERGLDEGLMLHGEGYGAGIQNGGGYRPDKAFVLFDVTENGRFLPRPAAEGIAKDLDVGSVPVIATLPLREWVEVIREGYYNKSRLDPHTDVDSEGVVLRTVVEMFDSYGNRMITKLKFKDFPN